MKDIFRPFKEESCVTSTDAETHLNLRSGIRQ